MAAPSLDNEFFKYWSLLTLVQKESLLSVVKSLIIPGEKITVEQYNKELDDAISRIEEGEFFSQEDVEKMSKEW